MLSGYSTVGSDTLALELEDLLDADDLPELDRLDLLLVLLEDLEEDELESCASLEPLDGVIYATIGSVSGSGSMA
ncbi:MAG: hypothetical protein ACOX6U_01765 [Oscillospiraceae bacterium]